MQIETTYFWWHLLWERWIISHHRKVSFLPSSKGQTSCFCFVSFFND